MTSTLKNFIPQVSPSFDSYQDTPGRRAFDRNYLERLEQGDPETEHHFVHFFGDRLIRKVRSRFRSGELAEDTRQETFLRVLHVIRNKEGIQYPERFAGYVNGVCENVASELFRLSNRHPQIPEVAPEVCDPALNAESELISQQRKAAILSVLSKLSATDQAILRKTFLEELDKDQICLEMGLQRNNLRVRIHRALVRFRAALQSEQLVQGIA